MVRSSLLLLINLSVLEAKSSASLLAFFFMVSTGFFPAKLFFPLATDFIFIVSFKAYLISAGFTPYFFSDLGFISPFLGETSFLGTVGGVGVADLDEFDVLVVMLFASSRTR